MPGRLRLALRRLGPSRLGRLGLLAQLLWGFAGSFLLGLRTPQGSDPALARLWLAGALLLALAALAAGLLASPGRAE